MKKKNFIELITKYYGQIYHITYLCTKDIELTDNIVKRVFARLYHNDVNFREEINYQRWLIKNTLRIIDKVKKCQCRKKSLMSDQQYAILYMKYYLNEPFDYILAIFERKDGKVSRQIGKTKNLLSNKGVTNIEEYISNILVNVPAIDEDKEKLLEDIVLITDTEVWENTLRKKYLYRNIKRYCVMPAITIITLLFVVFIGASIATYVKYNNWNIFEVMNYGDPGEKFEANEIAEDDGRSYTAGKMNVTLEKSWYSEKWRMGYYYFVITYEGRDMRLEDIDAKQIESEMLFGPDKNYALKLINYKTFADMYSIKYYTTKDALYVEFKTVAGDIKNGEKFAISFEDKRNMEEVGVFEFGEVSDDITNDKQIEKNIK
ncbi:MAG: hypothetical protein E7270_10590 [Lachnospiraceae bacterium]|nr:hypothetical protein [Lachnospiraceae bacterium]